MIKDPMIPKKHQPITVNSGWYYTLVRALTQRGIDIASLNIDGHPISDFVIGDQIPFDALKYLLVESYQRLGDHNFLLEAATDLDILEFGPPGIALCTAPDLERLIDTFCEIYASLGAPIRVVKKDNRNQIELWLLPANDDKAPFSVSYLGLTLYCGVIMQLLRYATNTPTLPIGFKMPGWFFPQSSIQSLSKRYHCQIEIEGNVRRIVIDKQWLNTPLKLADEALHAFCKQQAKTMVETKVDKRFSSRIRAVLDTMDATDFSSSALAKQMHMSSRTLNRRLLEEGMSIRSVIEQYKLEKALRLLKQTNNPITEVALELGFSDLSAFSRAFKKWSGISPKKFRLDLRPE
ncbi:helix-turn-helix transcriptional regulator [Vibrio sp. WXL103]|uniref:helix-turn-helix transcriptional regulator n=1 Tax=Vibrio sp. WXL103 TaxID=3450710 RepID=UPI003EC4EDDA